MIQTPKRTETGGTQESEASLGYSVRLSQNNERKLKSKRKIEGREEWREAGGER